MTHYDSLHFSLYKNLYLDARLAKHEHREITQKPKQFLKL